MTGRTEVQTGRRGRVLVAEDDPAMRAVIMRILGGAGFEVDAVPDGAAALQRLDHVEAPYDLMVCDVVMPELNGLDLVATVRERGEEPRVVFLSGAVVPAHGDEPDRIGSDVVLAKPFGPQQLLDAVAEAMA